jgi:hypothetical protein
LPELTRRRLLLHLLSLFQRVPERLNPCRMKLLQNEIVVKTKRSGGGGGQREQYDDRAPLARTEHGEKIAARVQRVGNRFVSTSVTSDGLQYSTIGHCRMKLLQNEIVVKTKRSGGGGGQREQYDDLFGRLA